MSGSKGKHTIMTSVINTLGAKASANTPAQTIARHHLQAGQIWKDNHRKENKHLLLVLHKGTRSAVCQNIGTGQITSVRCEQFNRGARGYSYVTRFTDLDRAELKRLLRLFSKTYADQLTKLAGASFSVAIRQELL